MTVFVSVPEIAEFKIPRHRFQLRWRIVAENNFQAKSEWTPETRFPSMRQVIDDLGNRIRFVCIDGHDVFTGKVSELLCCPAGLFVNISYKAVHSQSEGKTSVVGIQIDASDGKSYIGLVDGTVYIETTRKE